MRGGSPNRRVEGFLIMFRCQGMMRGWENLAEHPPRMQGQQQLQYWWNIGGWQNTQSQIETWGVTKAGANSDYTVETGDWYNIKIGNTSTSYALYLNDEKADEINDDSREGVGRVGLGTWDTLAKYEDVMVYGPRGPLPVDPKGKVATVWGLLKVGR